MGNNNCSVLYVVRGSAGNPDWSVVSLCDGNNWSVAIVCGISDPVG